MRKNVKILGAVAVAGLVATTGSAFTAGNTVTGNNVAGYGSSTVSGATTEVVEHTLSADGTTVVSTALTFTTDLGADHQVKSGFGSTALEACTVTVNTAPAKDTAVCSYAGAGYLTSAATDFRVAVS